MQLTQDDGATWQNVTPNDVAAWSRVTMERTSGDVERLPVTVTSPSLIALADQAAATLASVATAERSILARRD